ncbi:MAG: Cof-type HAD-IIB family hydrolase [Synergistaceae bacterium]|jgi:Cof subfamily protein (haloacid dehalogenase superfamily)|nr:Cof-type HAD-IIB family hydrolase [Synergistaceae bacterium]
MKSKLVFFDIDGTLVSYAGKSHVPEPTVEALKRLAQKGHVPAVATGRNLALTRKTASSLGIDSLVCCNGAQGIRKGESLYEVFLSEDFTQNFRSEFSSSSRKSYALDAENVYTNMNEDYLDAYLLEQAGHSCKKNLISAERVHLVCVFDSDSFPPQWRKRRKSWNLDIVEFPNSTEFRPSGTSKWSGIVRLATAVGFDVKDIVTVGDGLNDMDMIQNASLGIAVGGAKPELKAVADFITQDIDEGGIFSAFCDLGLI